MSAGLKDPMEQRRQVQTQFFTFADTPDDLFPLERGGTFGPITIAYETYGELSPARDNAVLVFHAFSGSQHAAGYNPSVPGVERLWTDECQVGWWDPFIGPGRALDTREYFVICANYLGGCYGTTGPASINPETGKPYGRLFPVLTLGDMVNSQMRLLDHLGIERLLAVAGGSLGGMMALDLAARFSERVHCVIPVATGARATTLHKLHNFEQIFAIEEDPHFDRGDYYDGPGPRMGLTLARMIAHKSFVHLHVMEDRARTMIRQEEDDLKGYRLEHQIESYMLHQGKKFVSRFDANTYLRILSAWQNFDLTASAGGDLCAALAACREHKFLVFSIDSDVCYWPEEQDEIYAALKTLDIDLIYITVHSDKGHDSFLLEPKLYAPHIAATLKETLRKVRA